MSAAEQWPGRRILFVDDDPADLELTRRSFQRSSMHWEMTFARSGQEALSVFRARPFDVVVSDFRMPGITGIELLSEIRRIAPRTLRIIVSGHLELSALLEAVGPCHQCLPKPCDLELLKARIERAFALRDEVWDAQLLDWIGGLDTVPSFPDVHREVVDAIQCGLPAGEIGAIVARDAGLSARVLQVVNSIYFRKGDEIEDPALAAGLLGVETLHSVVLGGKIFAEFQTLPGIREIWNASTRAASFAKKIATLERADPVVINQAVTASFVKDIGLLLIAVKDPELFSRLAGEKERNGEGGSVGVAAAQEKIGGCLLALWGLPDPIVEAVAFHHTPRKAGVMEFGPLAIVHVAHAFARSLPDATDHETLRCVGIDPEYLDHLGLLGNIGDWRRVCSNVR